MARPSHSNPPPPTTHAAAYPFAPPESPASRSDTSASSDSPPGSPIPLVHFQKLARRGNGPVDAIRRMRGEVLRGEASGVTEARYTASIDDRAYIPVYEFPIENASGTQTIMIDSDTGFVLWTAIWKSLGNSKADIVKLVESYEGLEEKIIKIRGGFLKIQGTWAPYEVALLLAQRVAYNIRHALVPLFGPTFPEECFAPNQLGYGQVTLAPPGSRAPRRAPRRMTGPSGGPPPSLGRPVPWANPNNPPSGGARPGRSNSVRSIGSSQSGHTVPSSSGGSASSERWSPYPHPSLSSGQYHSEREAASHADYLRHSHPSPRSTIHSPPSSFPSSGGNGHTRGSGFILPSPIIPGPDSFHRSQHSESSLPRSRQATYSQDDVQILRRFTTSVGGSPPRRAEMSSLAALGRPIVTSSASAPSFKPPSPPPFSLPPISSLTSPREQSTSYQLQIQAQSYRIPSAAEQSRRRQRSDSVASSVHSAATSSSDSYGHHSSYSSHSQQGLGMTPLTPLFHSPYATLPSSSSASSSAHSSVYDGSTSSSSHSHTRLPSLSMALFDAPTGPAYHHQAPPSPSAILRSLRMRDSSPSPPRLDGGVAMEIDRSGSSDRTTTTTSGKATHEAEEEREGDHHHHHHPYVGGLGVYFPESGHVRQTSNASSTGATVAGTPSGAVAPIATAATGEDNRQRSTSFRPW